jgi:hypothetical protein
VVLLPNLPPPLFKRLPGTLAAVTGGFNHSLQIAQGIYHTLWGKPLDDFLCEASTDVEGTSVHYQYYTQALIEASQLSHLKFQEKVLLIREEYVSLYELLQSSHRQRGGVIVTGQPGIGEHPSPAILAHLLTNLGTDQARHASFSLFCFND